MGLCRFHFGISLGNSFAWVYRSTSPRGKQTPVCLSVSFRESIRIRAGWQSTPGDNAGMEKTGVRGLFASGCGSMGSGGRRGPTAGSGTGDAPAKIIGAIPAGIATVLNVKVLCRLANASYQIVIEGSSYRERLSPHRKLMGQTEPNSLLILQTTVRLCTPICTLPGTRPARVVPALSPADCRQPRSEPR